MQSITSEDLLLYLYGETTPQQSKAIASALQSDWNLKEKYELLKVSIDELSEISFGPEQKTIDNIMAYAQKTTEILASHP